MTADGTQTLPEHVDVLIVGAGLSGIGTACHMARRTPDREFLILEARAAIGGTWDLFRYPGVRSDSDLGTFSFAFKPWTQDEAIATGTQIRDYLEAAASEHQVTERIRFGQRVISASWSSEAAQWTVRVQGDDGERTLTAAWLFGATGYYRYDRGHDAEIPGLERFEGIVAHPQFWDEQLDYADKNVVIIGSGATAVTMLPAMAEHARRVTMLQRSPTYVTALPSRDPIAMRLRQWFGDARGHALTRRKNLAMSRSFYRLCRRYPRLMRWVILSGARRELPRDFDAAQHFSPRYAPWDQRVCVAPDGDLFRAVRDGKADIVTDRIVTVTETGIRLESGRHLAADVIVTATGLELLALGGVELDLDGKPVVPREHFAYQGMMLDGVPNFAFAIGYVNISWTLKLDLVAEYFCRLLEHMTQHSLAVATPASPPPEAPQLPLLDFAAGYIQRSVELFPQQTTVAPWVMNMDYYDDVRVLRDGPVGRHMTFAAHPTAVTSRR